MAAQMPTLITLRDLEACTNPVSIAELFRKLRYPVELPPASIPLEYGDLPATLSEQVVERYPLAVVGGDRPGTPVLSVTLFVLRRSQQARAALRGIAQIWTRRVPGYHLLVFVDQPITDEGAFARVTFVNTRRLGEGADVRIRLHKLVVERTHPTRHDVETLNQICIAPAAMGAQQLYEAQCAAFDVERLTDTFYREYARRFNEAKAHIRDANPALAAVHDPVRLHAFTQRLFGRIMFLYFLQKKGALNANPNFITNWYERAAREQQNFYREVLEPLFFQTLNTPANQRQSSAFGRIPYLNGGLFAADADDLVGEVYLDNELFDTRSEAGLLYFLNRHNFTIEEDTPLEVEVALDPEMLGKVFENLLEVEERGKSGTFYTPRSVVAFMCREALASYLSTAVEGLDAQRMRWLLDEAETGEPVRDEHEVVRLTNTTFHRSLRERTEQALEAIRVLDPAVGSGAFPLGMLALLVGVRRALYRMAGAEIEPHSHLVEGWKRNFIRDCLYGVDIKREAIEIARLRLWLSLVVDADPFDMEPLPNLDYKLMDGDSLIETLDGVEIYPTRSGQTVQNALFEDTEAADLTHELERLQRTYFQPEDGTNRAELRASIRMTETQLVRHSLKQRRQNEEERLKRLLQRVANLGTTSLPRELAAEQNQLTRSIDATDTALRDLSAGKSLPFFLYGLHFKPVFTEKDGFDIVIANPPYVRHEKVAPATLTALKATYPDVAHGMADLYVYFYARALELLHEGGTLCFVSSNKFFRAGYGEKLRKLLQAHTAMRIVLDFGDFPVFDAAAYPCVVITRKGAPTPDHTYRGLTAGPDIELDKLEEVFAATNQSCEQEQSIQPPSGSAATLALVRKLMSMGTPLGKLVNGRIYYGVKTGRNEAFVVDQATCDRLIAENPRSAEVLKPFLRGRDVGRYAIHSANLWLIRIENGWTATSMGVRKPQEQDGWRYFQRTYPAIARHLQRFEEPCRKRDDQGQFWWELRPCDYYDAFEQPKIVYPDIAPRMEFAWDTGGRYLGNTNYLLSTNHRFLCALLNSRLAEFVYSSLTPQIRGGYFRFFSQYLENLPIVEPTASDKRWLEEVVDRIQALGGTGPEAEVLEREVDLIVYRTYGLSQEEIAAIERWHVQRRTLLGGKRGRATLVSTTTSATELNNSGTER